MDLKVYFYNGMFHDIAPRLEEQSICILPADLKGAVACDAMVIIEGHSDHYSGTWNGRDLTVALHYKKRIILILTYGENDDIQKHRAYYEPWVKKPGVESYTWKWGRDFSKEYAMENMTQYILAILNKEK